MKRQWLAYVIVGLVSVGSGVAIAGLPDNVPVDATILPPSTTPETTVPEPATTTTPPTTTAVPTATAPPATSSSTPGTTALPESELAERSGFRVAVANSANIAGAATRFASQLEALGYVEVSALDGTGISQTSVVFHADGLELAAARLAEDLQLPPTAIAPLAAAPPVDSLPADTQLLVVIGLDLA